MDKTEYDLQQDFNYPGTDGGDWRVDDPLTPDMLAFLPPENCRGCEYHGNCDDEYAPSLVE